MQQRRAEPALGDGVDQIDVGRRDQPHVHAARGVPAHRRDLTALEGAQQHRLDVARGVADLVHEQGAAVGAGEDAFVRRGGAAEGTAGVPEQGRRGQGGRHGGHVDGHEGAPGARAGGVQGAGDQLLAAARLTRQQHGAAERGHPPDGAAQRLDRLAVADQPQGIAGLGGRRPTPMQQQGDPVGQLEHDAVVQAGGRHGAGLGHVGAVDAQGGRGVAGAQGPAQRAGVDDLDRAAAEEGIGQRGRGVALAEGGLEARQPRVAIAQPGAGTHAAGIGVPQHRQQRGRLRGAPPRAARRRKGLAVQGVVHAPSLPPGAPANTRRTVSFGTGEGLGLRTSGSAAGGRAPRSRGRCARDAGSGQTRLSRKPTDTTTAAMAGATSAPTAAPAPAPAQWP